MSLLRGPRSSWMNQARRNYLHSVRVDGAPRYDEREPFACFYLCDTCGYLGRENGECGACGSHYLIDLGHTPTFHALEDAQGRDHSLRWSRARRAFGIGLALLGLGVGATATAVAHSPGAWFAMGIVGVVAAGMTMTGGTSPNVLAAKHEGLAPKWRGPTRLPPRRGRPTAMARGSARAVGTIESPLHAAACVAYAIRVYDEDEKLVLEEHANVAIELGGQALPEDSVVLDGAFQRVLPGARLEQVRQWLRARGVRYLDGMRFAELVVAPGANADLARSGDAWVLAPRTGGATPGYR